jgi:hypothetical protein
VVEKGVIEYAQKLIDLRDTYVVTVLHGRWPASAPELGIKYVKALRESIWQYVPRLPFLCFTDREIPGVCTRYLPPWLPGFWGKLYAFSPVHFPLNSRVLVLDLDTAITGPLDDILSVPLDKPVFIRDAWLGRAAQSGMFSFKVTPRTAQIWNDFPHGSKGPPFAQANSDEEWLRPYLEKGGWAAWEDLVPGQVRSYKHHLHQSDEPLPDSVSVVYFDGEPRPHDVRAEWNVMGQPQNQTP